MPEIQIYVKRSTKDNPINDVHHGSFLSGALHAYIVQNKAELGMLFELGHIGPVMCGFFPVTDGALELDQKRKQDSARLKHYTSNEGYDFVISLSPSVPKKHVDGLVACIECPDYVIKVQQLKTDVAVTNEH